ncbi:MAG: hypothetical protein LBE59_04635 [Nevskiaceae bacterium]|nr:hypothetical protein [Nevskiaceae bacterium]
MTARVLRIALLLLCFATSTAQNWAAQWHFHGQASRDAVAVQASPSFADNEATPLAPPHPAQCLLCDALCPGAGALLATVPPLPVVAPLRFFVLAPADESVSAALFRSHHWSSRGPPHA